MRLRQPVQPESSAVMVPREFGAGGSSPEWAKTALGLRSRYANRAVCQRQTAWSNLSLHGNESMATVRFKTVVGRSKPKARFCHHDRTTLPTLRGKNGPDKKHVPLLCNVDRAKPLRRNLPDTALGSYRRKGSNDDTPFRAGTGCGSAFPASHPPEKKPRISHPSQQQSLIATEAPLSIMKAERKSAIAILAPRSEGISV